VRRDFLRVPDERVVEHVWVGQGKDIGENLLVKMGLINLSSDIN
jgi:hypothetical protein